ncbi:metal-dependent hydrolase [Candidatus Latescibacterota bacterium]
MDKTKITWLGHASVKVEFKELVFYFDPWIEANPACNLKLEDIKKATAVCVTHGHLDHIGDSIEIVKQTGAKFVCHPGVSWYANKYGIKDGSENSHPLAAGGSWITDNFTIKMVQAVHTSDIMCEGFKVDESIEIGSGSVGFVLHLKDGPTIYFSGDTDVFGDMAIIRDLHCPQIAILTAGGRYNMGYREAAYATALLQPEYVITTHHGTWPPDQMLDFDQLEAEMKVRSPKANLVRIKPGESFEY